MFANLFLICFIAYTNADQLDVKDKVIKGLQDSFLSLDDSSLTDTRAHEINELLRDLRFEPPHIDFGSWSVSQARSRTVTLVNQNSNRSVQLNAVSGSIPAFYSSLLESREIPPLGNTTFNVVFLPRKLGAISTDLHIHTSFGRAELSVRGEGHECPYRLKPLVGIKAPINAILTPEIYMYNPHKWPLKILDVYSSNSDFQLGYTCDMQPGDGVQKLCEIPPYSAQSITRFTFHGRAAGNYSTYIRLKITEQFNETIGANENILVIPVEFEILPKRTVYVRNPVVNFGRLTTTDTEPIRFKLDIEQLDDNCQLRGNYLRDILGLSYDENNSSIVLFTKHFTESVQIDDLLVLRCSHMSAIETLQEFTVLVHAEIFKGDLFYNGNTTIFISGTPNLQTKRILVVRNDFQIPICIYKVALVQPINSTQLDIKSIENELILHPSESVEVLHLYLQNSSALFTSLLRIDTNITTFTMPVVACTGKLHVTTQAQLLNIWTDAKYNVMLNLGAIPYAEMSHNGFILLRNDNPIPVKISNWDFKSPESVYFHVHFMGCLPATTSTELVTQNVILKTDSTKFKFCAQLNAADTAVFQLAIQTFVTDPSICTLKIWTTYEEITTSVKFKAKIGQLEVAQEHLNFKNCFPGKICTSVISIRSTFLQPIQLTSINFTQTGLRFKDFNAKGTKIAPQTLTKVGRIYFEPTAMCRERCYTSGPDNVNPSYPFVSEHKSIDGNNNNLQLDDAELRRRMDLYRHMLRHLQSMSLTLYSRELPPLELEFTINIDWPRLAVKHWDTNQPPLTTEISRVQRQLVELVNPIQSVILVDYYLSDPKYAKVTQVTMPRELINTIGGSCFLTDKPVFSLPDGQPEKPIILLPGASLTIPIDFYATLPERYCTLLHIRNNLSLYEAVWIGARSVQSQFRFGNRKPGSTTPLLFEITEQQFETCGDNLGTVETTQTPIIMTKRTFIARNTGVLPMRVDNFLIDDQSCVGYGFKVNDCYAFELRENDTRKIEIIFKTDFTNARVQRPLILKTNLSYEFSYILLAQMPITSLEKCAAHISRPTWESWIGKIAAIALALTFILVLTASIIDYREIMVQQTVLYAARYKGAIQPTFNLRNISSRLSAHETEISSSNKSEAANSVQRHLKNSHNNVRKRTNLSLNSVKKSKWSPWNMKLLLYKPETVRNESPKINTLIQTEENIVKFSTDTMIPAARTTMHSNETKSKKLPPSQPLRQSKKSRNITQAAVIDDKTENEKNLSMENVSPKPIDQTLYSPALDVKKNVSMEEQQQQKVLKEQNGSTIKKLGKTPGRERRREQTASMNGATKKLERKRFKQLKFDSITTPMSQSDDANNALNCITSPWETSRHVTFSEVLQAQRDRINLPISITNQQGHSNGMEWNGIATCTNQVADIIQLGPIGSKKTAMHNFNWDLTDTTTTHPAPIATPELTSQTFNTEIFSTAYPTDGQLTGVSADIYELEQLRQNQWQASDILLHKQKELEQQQEQEKQQQQKELLRQQLEQHQRRTLQQTMDGNWSTTWSPLAFGAPWQATSILPGIIRPPPGLESNINHIRHLPIQSSTSLDSTTITATAAAAVDVNIAQTQTRPANDSGIAKQYDLFNSSLSSIWSDNWPHNGQTPGQQNHNHTN